LREGIRAYREVLAQKPTSVQALAGLGQACRSLGRLEEARELLSRALELRPDRTEVRVLLSEVLLEKGDVEGAADQARWAIELDEAVWLPAYNLGTELLGRGRPADAVSWLRIAVERREHPDALLNLGLALKKVGEVDDARRALRRLLEIDEHHAGAWSNLGSIHEAQGRPEKAVAAYRKALDLDPDLAESHHNLGSLLGSRGEHGEAVKHLRRALEIDPGFADTHRVLGALYCDHLDEVDRAIEHFEIATRLEPTRPLHWRCLGIARRKNGDLDGALDAFVRVRNLRPGKAQSHFDVALTNELLGRVDAAIASYRRTVERNDRYGLAHTLLARLLADRPEAKRRRPDEALPHARRAVEVRPDRADFRHVLGIVLLRSGRFEAAIRALEKGAALRGGGDPHDWLPLAIACARSGRVEDAREWLRKSLARLEETGTSDPTLQRHREEAEELVLRK
jgi:tetratricopeptide (TPR) repeat protein